MLTLDPTGLRPDPLNDTDTDMSTVDQLEVDLYTEAVPSDTSDTESDTSDEFSAVYDCSTGLLYCGEGPLPSSDSEEETDGHPRQQPEDPTIDELLEELVSQDLGESLAGWTCYFCRNPLTPRECFIHGTFDSEHNLGMCNMCYASTLEDLMD